MALDLDDIIRGLREGTLLFFDARSNLRYFEEQDRVGFRYSEELGTCRVDKVLYCYTDVDECYLKEWCNTRPELEVFSYVTGEEARYVKNKITEIRYMKGMDALRAYIDLALFIFRHRVNQ